MFIPVLAWILCIFWAIAYATRTSYDAKLKRHVLPTAGRISTTKPQLWRMQLRNFHLKLETTYFNSLHDKLSYYFENSGTRNALSLIYDLGIVLGVLGVAAGLAVLSLACYQVLIVVLTPKENIMTGSLKKREMYTLERTSIGGPGLTIHAIIPGITVPFSHAPILLFALFVAQCIHEFGHAVAAAIESVPLYSVGASLTILLPAAFVSISPSLSTLSPRRRLRIIGAGAWHNMLLYLTIYSASAAGLNRIWLYLGWEDVTTLGVSVLSVDEDSPLIYHIRPGSIITSLDDTILSTEGIKAKETWTDFLNERPHQPSGQGWCIKSSSFFESPTNCCAVPSGHSLPPLAQLSCFVPASTGTEALGADVGRCVDPVPLFTSAIGQWAKSLRCSSASDCLGGGLGEEREKEKTQMECVRPTEGSQLLRIAVVPPPWEGSDIEGLDTESGARLVLWNGPRDEIYEQVTIGGYRSKSKFLSIWIPEIAYVLFDYLATLSLSLFVFNLFALPFLDGSQFLSALLDLVGEVNDGDENDIDLSSVESGINTHHRRMHNHALRRRGTLFIRQRYWVRRRKAIIERTLWYSTISLMLVAIVGMVYVGA